MAIDKRKKSEQPEKTGADAGMSQRRRWLTFGPNVVLAILLATAVMAGSIWLSGALLRGRARSDWTQTGRFSLSPRSKALVADLPCDVRITNLYVHAPENPPSEEQYQRVQDLVSQYGAASSKVTVEEVNPAIDSGGVESLVKRLRDRYAKELEKPKAVIENFDKLQKDTVDFLNAEAKRLDQAAAVWKDGPPEAVNALRMVSQRWKQFATVGQLVAGDVKGLTEQALPAYATALTRGKDYFKQVGENFAAVPELYSQLEEASKAAPPPAEVKAILAGAKTTYEPLKKRFEEFDKAAAEQKSLELDTLRSEISGGDVILLESPAKVQVVGFDDVWVRNPQADEQHPDAPERLFAGEAAVSSSLLGMCNPDKPAVLFITFGAPATMGGNPMMGGGGGAYAQIAERLRKANFLVEDWDLARSPEMPHPEHMTKAILVFVPPPPPSMQQPMPPATPEMYKAAIDAVKAGTPAIVLGEPGSFMAPGIPYAELFDLFGTSAKTSAMCVHKVVVDAMGAEKAVPQIEITDYLSQAITEPLKGLPTMFLAASPIVMAKQIPEGVAAEPIIALPAGSDYWADTNVMAAMRGEAKFDAAEDLVSKKDEPLALAVAATRKVKDPKDPKAEVEQKAVLFGGARFAEDRVAFYRDMLGRELFPGNAELFVNSILWVAGTEHLITVSPETLQARRIGDLGRWPWLQQYGVALIFPPLAVTLIGLIVWAVRRR